MQHKTHCKTKTFYIKNYISQYIRQSKAYSLNVSLEHHKITELITHVYVHQMDITGQSN